MDIERIAQKLRVERKWLNRAILALERLEADKTKANGKEVDQIRRRAQSNQTAFKVGKVVQFPLKVSQGGRR